MAERVVLIVQARMTSVRLPGKVLMEVCERPLLGIQIERMVASCEVDQLVVATTSNATDDPIVALCKGLGIATFRGSEEDVLSRYWGAAEAFGAEVVARVTSDCPLLDPRVIDRVSGDYRQGGADYVSNTVQRTFPRGMDVEVFSRACLEEAHCRAHNAAEREHVTPYIYGAPRRFVLRQALLGVDLSHHRWTVDTEEDLALTTHILNALWPENPLFTMEDVLALLGRHPEWLVLNADVAQKRT